MTIPDKAVEAAADALLEIVPNTANAIPMWALQKALEAAAPYMCAPEPGSAMCEAMRLTWDQGYEAHMSDGYDYQSGNPYRGDPAKTKTSQDTPEIT